MRTMDRLEVLRANALRNPGRPAHSARLGNTWTTPKWREGLQSSLGVRARTNPFARSNDVPADLQPDPRMSWSPPTATGGVWPQPSRRFS